MMNSMEKNQPIKKRIGRSYRMQLNGGFTLTEIMIAVVVLGIGFMAAASMQIAAVRANTSANQMTAALNLAQSKMDQLMALEYSGKYTDPHLMDDTLTPERSEPYTDSNGNGFWSITEPYADENKNGIWDAAHKDSSPPAGYAVHWSVNDHTPFSPAKVIRVYVTSHQTRKTTILSCIKAGQ